MQRPLCGVLGLVVALIFEVALFIARANTSPGLGKKYEALWEPEAFKAKQQRAVPVEGQAFQTTPAAAAAAPLPAEAEPEPKKKR